jgi:3D-(3,5/4)-trihydroxycyclohexane-1,2-dione acylhydrolase (decyclizing)
MRNPETGLLDGDDVPLDLVRNAESFGVEVLVAKSVDDFRTAFRTAVASDRATLIHVETDLQGPNPPSSSWWDVPVSEVSTLPSTRAARVEYDAARAAVRHHL